jgi:hypothetical protein
MRRRVNEMGYFDQTSAGNDFSQGVDHATSNGTKYSCMLQNAALQERTKTDPVCNADFSGHETASRKGSLASAPNPLPEMDIDLGRERSDQKPQSAQGCDRPTSDDRTAHQEPTNIVYKNKRGISLDLKLRQQAAKLGMKPGSPRWRAYVLGTKAAAQRRKRG